MLLLLLRSCAAGTLVCCEATMEHSPYVCSIPPAELMTFCAESGYLCRLRAGRQPADAPRLQCAHHRLGEVPATEVSCSRRFDF